MKMTKAVLALISVTILISCSNSNSSSSQKSPEELRLELKEQEKSNPTQYLSFSGSYKESFWGDDFNITCKFENNASLVTYKDAVLRITYYSKTKTKLGAENYTVYELFPPSTTKTIELKIDNYKNVDSFTMDLLNAGSTN